MLIAHLSDPHLVPRGQLYHGLVDSNALFDAALRQVAAMDPGPDLVLISGDLVDDGAAASYALAREKLTALPDAGHPRQSRRPRDLPDRLRRPARDACRRPAASGDGPRPPAHPGPGYLGPRQPSRRDGRARADLVGGAPDRGARPPHADHDAPAPGARRHGLHRSIQLPGRGGAALEALIARHPQVERLLCAHIHRVITRRFGETLLMTAPSTATAIGLDLRDDPAKVSYLEPPAILLHHWRAETQDLVSHLVPIGPFPGPLPFY